MKMKFNFLTLLCILLLGVTSLRAQTTRGLAKRTTTYEVIERERNWEIHFGLGPSFSEECYHNSYYYDDDDYDLYVDAGMYIGLKQTIRLKVPNLNITFNENVGVDATYGRKGTLAAGLEYRKKYKENRSFFAEASLGMAIVEKSINDRDLYTNFGMGILFKERFSLSAQVHWCPNIEFDPNFDNSYYSSHDNYRNFIHATIQIGYYIF